jgi:hypothetical protein
MGAGAPCIRGVGGGLPTTGGFAAPLLSPAASQPAETEPPPPTGDSDEVDGPVRAAASVRVLLDLPAVEDLLQIKLVVATKAAEDVDLLFLIHLISLYLYVQIFTDSFDFRASLGGLSPAPALPL